MLLGTEAGARLRERLRAQAGRQEFAYSVITWFELCVKPDQREAARAMLSGFAAIPVSIHVAERASEIFEEHLWANRRHIPDALIAATAILSGARLWTCNERDFKRIPGLRLF